jgi:hypothetical protein
VIGALKIKIESFVSLVLEDIIMALEFRAINTLREYLNTPVDKSAFQQALEYEKNKYPSAKWYESFYYGIFVTNVTGDTRSAMTSLVAVMKEMIAKKESEKFAAHLLGFFTSDSDTALIRMKLDELMKQIDELKKGTTETPK